MDRILASRPKSWVWSLVIPNFFIEKFNGAEMYRQRVIKPIFYWFTAIFFLNAGNQYGAAGSGSKDDNHCAMLPPIIKKNLAQWSASTPNNKVYLPMYFSRNFSTLLFKKQTFSTRVSRFKFFRKTFFSSTTATFCQKSRPNFFSRAEKSLTFQKKEKKRKKRHSSIFLKGCRSSETRY